MPEQVKMSGYPTLLAEFTEGDTAKQSSKSLLEPKSTSHVLVILVETHEILKKLKNPVISQENYVSCI